MLEPDGGTIVISALLAAPNGPSERMMTDALLWALVLVAVLAISAMVLSVVRKRVLGRASNVDQCLTLRDVRQLRDTGRISTAEYDRLARAVAESALKLSSANGDPREAR